MKTNRPVMWLTNKQASSQLSLKFGANEVPDYIVVNPDMAGKILNSFFIHMLLCIRVNAFTAYKNLKKFKKKLFFQRLPAFYMTMLCISKSSSNYKKTILCSAL